MCWIATWRVITAMKNLVSLRWYDAVAQNVGDSVRAAFNTSLATILSSTRPKMNAPIAVLVTTAVVLPARINTARIINAATHLFGNLERKMLVAYKFLKPLISDINAVQHKQLAPLFLVGPQGQC
jgi:hypothetical protein